MKKEKGKLYTNLTKDLVVMCIRNSKEKEIAFEGIVLENGKLSVTVGTIADTWMIDNFIEKIGPLYLNNVTINN